MVNDNEFKILFDVITEEFEKLNSKIDRIDNAICNMVGQQSGRTIDLMIEIKKISKEINILDNRLRETQENVIIIKDHVKN